MIIRRGFRGFHPECGKDGVADVENGGERLFQLGDVDLPARVQVLGDLVQIVADAAAMTKDLTQCDMVCRRTALRTGAAVAVESGGAHECRETKPGSIGLGGNSVEFVVGVAQRTPPVPLPLVTAGCHAPTHQAKTENRNTFGYILRG